MSSRRPQPTTEQVRRRVYFATALTCVLVLLVVGLYDYRLGQHQKVLSSVLSGALGLIAVLMISNRRISLLTIEYGVAVIMFVGSLSEWSNIVRENGATTRPYLTFLLLLSVWFGLLPQRVASALGIVTYLGFTLLLLTRPNPDLGAILYLAFASLLIGIMSVFGRQIAREREESALFQQQALTDPLTGVANRRAALLRLQALWDEADTRYSFAVMLVDLDHFKEVNDHYGHAVGDETLSKLAETLTDLFALDDLVARWGGEEFLIVLAYTDARQALVAAQKIHGKLLSWEALPSITVSAGGAFSHEVSSLSDLLKLADQRLYWAKQHGRNQVRWEEQSIRTSSPAPRRSE